MGEYVIHQEGKIKIGSCEELMFISFDKYLTALRKGMVRQAEHSAPPLLYMAPKSESLFRLPYPDEDTLPLGSINGDAIRGISFVMSAQTYKEISGREVSESVHARLLYQKLIPANDTGLLVLGIIVDTPAGLFRAGNETIAGIIRSEAENTAGVYATNDLDGAHFKELMGRVMSGYKSPMPILQKQFKSDPLLDKIVSVPPELTTDPYDCRGMIGKVIATCKDRFGNTDVLSYFEGRQIGVYQADALLTLYPQSVIKQGLISNASMISSDEIKTALTVMKHMRKGDYRNALAAAKSDPAALFFCTTTCTNWVEMITAKRQSQQKGLRNK